MGKTRTKLRKYIRRRRCSAVSAKAVQLHPTGTKRKRTNTPLKKTSHLKSPFKSPLYSRPPSAKRFKYGNKSIVKSPYRQPVRIGKCKGGTSPQQQFQFKNENSSRKTPARTLFQTPCKVQDTPQLSQLFDSSESSSATASADESDTFFTEIEETEMASENDSTDAKLVNEVTDVDEVGKQTDKTIRNVEQLENEKESTESIGTIKVIDIDEMSKRTDKTTQNVQQLETGKESIEQMHRLIPSVMRTLSEHDGMDQVMVQFFEMVSEKTFPLDNISFLLWTEVVKWYNCSSTTQMRYTNETKQFWKLGWRMFGKRFVNFMGGFKSHGNTVLKMAECGHYDPSSSEINFAVPDVSVLRDFDPYKCEGEQKPGVLKDTMLSLSQNLNQKSACLTFDGKKVKQALTADSGDVDLLGFEKEQT